MLKMKLMVGATALILAGAAAQAASAQTQAYGGGSSLVGPYVRQAADCYGAKTDLLTRTSATTPPTARTLPDFNFTGDPAFDCAASQVNPNAQVNYIATGSGTGLAGVFSHDPAKFGDTNPLAGGTHPTLYPNLQFAFSETALGLNEANIYNNGGTFQGVTVTAPGVAPTGTDYANPHDKYGPLVQFPAVLTNVVLAYDPVYKKVRNASGTIKEYRLRPVSPKKLTVNGVQVSVGGFPLDAPTYCEIFNGTITDWNDPKIKAVNGGISPRDTTDPVPEASWTLPITIVGRNDSSGTTSLFTRHLAKVCGDLQAAGTIPTNNYADAASLLPAPLQGPVYDVTTANTSVTEVAGQYVRANGSEGVSKYVDFTAVPGPNAGDSISQGRLGYLGPDYALPYSTQTGSNTYGLYIARLKNSFGTFVLPEPVAARRSFGTILPPQSTDKGYFLNVGVKKRANPQDWVEPASKTSPLADPQAPAGATEFLGYPIVGTANYVSYSCLHDVNVTKALVGENNNAQVGFLDWYLNSTTVNAKGTGLLETAGLSPLPGAWIYAARSTFVSPSSASNNNTAALGLKIATAQRAVTNLKGGGSAACHVSGVVGG